MLVKTQSMYATLYDEESPVNVEHFMIDLLSRAKSDPRISSIGPSGALFIFNEYLMDCARRGELLPWMLLLDGVFECDAQLAHNMLSRSARIESLGNGHIAATLRVPSGRLVVSCLGDLGKATEPILRVDPGTYYVSFTRNGEAESKHWSINSEADYLRGESPDWVIRVSRADDERQDL